MKYHGVEWRIGHSYTVTIRPNDRFYLFRLVFCRSIKSAYLINNQGVWESLILKSIQGAFAILLVWFTHFTQIY